MSLIKREKTAVIKRLSVRMEGELWTRLPNTPPTWPARKTKSSLRQFATSLPGTKSFRTSKTRPQIRP